MKHPHMLIQNRALASSVFNFFGRTRLGAKKRSHGLVVVFFFAPRAPGRLRTGIAERATTTGRTRNTQNKKARGTKTKRSYRVLLGVPRGILGVQTLAHFTFYTLNLGAMPAMLQDIHTDNPNPDRAWPLRLERSQYQQHARTPSKSLRGAFWVVFKVV